MRINPEPLQEIVGGKAHHLYQIQEKCLVPPFFVLSFDDPSEIHDAQVIHAIQEECRAQQFRLMAVRSSAQCEDSAQASFAGIFETVLGVRALEIIGAIERVLASVQKERVRDYSLSQGIDLGEIRMAVIVQKLLDSRVSGVCFTRRTRNDDTLLIEACYGLGEALVSGRVTADSYTMSRMSLSPFNESIGYQKIMLQTDQATATVSYVPVPFHQRNAKKLTRSELITIAETCLVLEGHLNFPAIDVEWAFEGTTLYILQARPYNG